MKKEDKDLAVFIADVSFGGEHLKIVKASRHRKLYVT
jgi:hypothetical protein